ncbi:hypothetical protein CN692_10800 [Bacillus sp. AFS002410]|uniref:hypothetical protein n=1 Tax=Bacillus sp. AFS002410 TaxID=2033481 RepID=UPI000BF0776D|nr:hypothetical protein [Bacillus sp. AFS002410]PEJ57973.1 hypothetical protein CN692_10800 [Bacillus sp. AFS002410]
MNIDTYGMFSFKILGKSLKNLYYRYSIASKAMIGSGITLGVITKMIAGSSMYYIFTPLAIAMGEITAAVWYAGFILGTSAVAGIIFMGTWVCFK